jgi:hypothetical protein
VDEFIAAQSGESLGDARKQRQTSERLKDLPSTEDELRKGNLSREQSDLIAGAANANPAAEQQLLDDAKKKSVKELKERADRARAAGDRSPEETAKRVHRNRKLTDWSKGDGSHSLYGNGPVDDMAILNAALQPGVDNYYRTRRGTAEQAERQAYRWDALVDLCRQSLDQRNGTTPPPGDPDSPNGTNEPDAPDGSSGSSKSKGSGGPRYLGILKADLAALVRGWVEGDEVCEIAGLGPVPVNRARELLGDASLRLVLTKGVDVQNVTNLGHGVTAAQRIALLWSQPGCTNIACGNTWVENDHREPYAKVKRTELRNIDPLCPHDHDLKTYKGWDLVQGTGPRAFVPPDHPHHPKNRPPETQAGTDPPDQPDAPPPGHAPPAPSRDGEPPELFPDTS